MRISPPSPTATIRLGSICTAFKPRPRSPSSSRLALPNVETPEVFETSKGLPAQRHQALPRAHENTRVAIVKIGGEPARRTRALDRVPGLAAVRCLEQAGRELVDAVREQEADFVVDETNLVQAGQRVDEQPFPGDAAVAREQDDADAAA